jgi:hypothetical protein
MSITDHPFDAALSVIDLVLHHLEDVFVAFLGMRDGAGGTVFEAVPVCKGAAALEKVERTPAKEA